jgi:integrase
VALRDDLRRIERLRRLGHATIAITLRTYSHALPTMQRDAAEKMDALLRRDGRSATTGG